MFCPFLNRGHRLRERGTAACDLRAPWRQSELVAPDGNPHFSGEWVRACGRLSAWGGQGTTTARASDLEVAVMGRGGNRVRHPAFPCSLGTSTQRLNVEESGVICRDESGLPRSGPEAVTPLLQED